ncbi:MAG TPA: protein kinase [Planctomycetota bacterium]|nr:protein kinase [Planctomycetota bacterium]
MTKMDDDALGKLLLERGLLASDEYQEAMSAHRSTGKPLAEVLVEKSMLSPIQLQDALAAFQKRVRFCPECKGPVYIPRMMAEGERCPRCLGPIQWQEESVVAQIRDLDNIVQLTHDELPPEVQAARGIPGRLFGKYVLLDEVGKGGAGVVYKAWDTMLADYVALKFIREHAHNRKLPGSIEARRQRQEQILDLLQEARAALRLRHEHIVAVRDIGRIEQQFYIAMDFIEGRTLAEHIHSSQSRGLPSPLYEDPAFYLGAIRDVCNALHYAHTFPKPIVHCDLKPGNILMSKTGTAYVMDFGLARVLGGPPTGEGEEKVRGTPAYMAPEQLSGKTEDISVRTDVYAIGATLYEMLAGRPIFTGEPLSILVQAMRNLPEKPTDVVKKSTGRHSHDSTKMLMKISKLEEVCLKCLARDPKDRFPGSRDVAGELSTVLAAIEAGRETGMIPQRVLEAQERSELHRIDSHITRFDLDSALEETRELAKKRDTTHIRERIDDRRRQVELMNRLRERLVAGLNAQRPSFEEFQIGPERFQGVEVLKATPKKLYLLIDDESRDVEWSRLPAEQVVAMAEAVKLASPEDRLALGILCHHALMAQQALRYLNSLAGTPHEAEARRVLESTA